MEAHPQTATAFEDEVRALARELWPSALHGGASLEDRDERDVFVSEDMVYAIECAATGHADETEPAVERLARLVARIRSDQHERGVKGWLVTPEEPTSALREIAGRHAGSVQALSLDQFRAKLAEARKYLELRTKHLVCPSRRPPSPMDR